MRRNRSKYGSKKTVVDGIKFDSLSESQYYVYLKAQKEAGKVISFELQPTFLLIKSFRARDGKLFRKTEYKADFKVIYADGTEEIHDVKSKGTITEVFKIKRKLFESQYPELLFYLVEKETLASWKKYR